MTVACAVCSRPFSSPRAGSPVITEWTAHCEAPRTEPCTRAPTDREGPEDLVRVAETEGRHRGCGRLLAIRSPALFTASGVPREMSRRDGFFAKADTIVPPGEQELHGQRIRFTRIGSRSARTPSPHVPPVPVFGRQTLHTHHAPLARRVNELIRPDHNADVRGAGCDGGEEDQVTGRPESSRCKLRPRRNCSRVSRGTVTPCSR